jgi:hypothetical protein
MLNTISVRYSGIFDDIWWYLIGMFLSMGTKQQWLAIMVGISWVIPHELCAVLMVHYGRWSVPMVRASRRACKPNVSKSHAQCKSYGRCDGETRDGLHHFFFRNFVRNDPPTNWEPRDISSFFEVIKMLIWCNLQLWGGVMQSWF